MSFLNGAEFRANSGPTLTAFLQYACLLVRDAAPWERDYRPNLIWIRTIWGIEALENIGNNWNFQTSS